MGVSTKIEYGGRIYESVTKFAEAHGLHYGNTIRRYRSGWTIEECINPSIRIRSNNRGTKVTIEGMNFESLTAAAKFYGETRENVTARFARGWTIEQAVCVEPPPDFRSQSKSIEIKFLGENFPSKTARDKFYGLNKSCIEKRLARGWSERQAAGLDPKPSKKRDWKEREIINGKVYPKGAKGSFKLYVIKNSVNAKEYVGITISPLKARFRGHCREAFGLNENNKFKNALRKYGKEKFKIELLRRDAKSWPELEEQEKAEIKKRDCFKNGYNSNEGGGINSSKSITIDGVVYASHESAAEFFDMGSYLLNSRLRAGWSPEQAVGIALPYKPYSHEIIIGNRTYKSLQKACEGEKKDYKTVWARWFNYGWSLEQAFDLEDPPESYNKYQPGNKIKLKNKMEFESQSKMAEFLGVSSSSITQRTKNGQSYQSIFDHFKNKDSRKRIKH